MSFQAESALVNIVEPGLGFKRGKLLPASGHVATVIHTTGFGVVERYRNPPSGWPAWAKVSPFAVTRFLYGHRMDACGHFVVECGPKPQVGQFVPLAFAAWHVGGKGARVFFTKADAGRWGVKDPRMAWWFRTWVGLQSPKELAGGHLWDPYTTPPSLMARMRHPFSFVKEGSCNAWTKGIEVTPNPNNAGGLWHADTVDTVAVMVRELHSKSNIPIARDTVLRHSDCHPLNRTDGRGRPWDPPTDPWNQLMEALGLPRRGV